MVVITEVLPKNCDTRPSEDDFSIRNYNIHSNIDDNNCSRGVCIYIKETLRSSKKTSGLPNHSFKESVWCEVSLINNDKLLIGGVYRSPNCTAENNVELNTVIRQLSTPSHVLICGDFNHPEINWDLLMSTKSEEHKSSQFLTAIQDSFLFQHVDQPTHHRADQEPTLIDLILTNEEPMVPHIEYLPPLGMSHHSGLKFDYICYSDVQKEEMEPYEVYKFYAGNYDAMRRYIEDLNLQNTMNSNTAREAWDTLHKALSSATKQFVPRKKIVGPLRDTPPWMNDKIKQKSQLKRLAYDEKRKHNNEANRKKYARIRNQVKWEVRKAVKQYEKKIAEESKNNPKAFYKYAKSKMKCKSRIPDINHNGIAAECDNEKAEMLNRFFTSVFVHEDKTNIPKPDTVFNGPKLSNIVITDEMVKKKLDSLNPNKSPGVDRHHPRILKELKEQLVTPLTMLFRKSLEEGFLPPVWRRANITPIYKSKGSKTSPNNYRPVSLTSILCKLLESIVKDHIINHLKVNNLLYPHQHAFIGKRSATTQILEALDVWTNLLENGDSVDAIYLDFAKAFDTVPHLRLLEKCKALGIDGLVLQWLKAFLEDRKQRVLVNGSPSTWSDVASGVPQGSVIGPILFVIFVNDMPAKLNNFISLFADDAKLFGKSTNQEDHSSIQEDLSKLQQWSSVWKLKFNETKCKTLYLGNNDKLPYVMDTTDGRISLEESNLERDLGVLIDNNLAFDEHIAQAIKKANGKLALIKRTFVNLDRTMLVQLYTGMVRPLLEYGNVVWSPHLQKHIKALEAVQHRATRLIPGLATLSYEDRLSLLQLPSLSYRRLRGDMIEFYKYCHKEYDVQQMPFKLHREVNTESTTRDNGFKIWKEKCRTGVRAQILGNRSASIWNTLPREVVNAPSLNSFKSRLDRLWQHFMYIEDLRTVTHRTNSSTSINLD